MVIPIVLRHNDYELPCDAFLDGNKIQCPIRENWLEGERVTCAECKWNILYDRNQNFDYNGNKSSNPPIAGTDEGK
jgi:hypothetical protein